VTPQFCKMKHQPPHSYGDCLRACVATVMDFEPDFVPHFADKGVSGEQALADVRKWFGQRGLTVACFAFPGSESLSDLLDFMEQMNPTVTYLLFGSTTTDGPSDHVNVCKGGKIIHDPSWVPNSIKAPSSDGIWQIWVIARL